MIKDGRISRFHTESNNLVALDSFFLWLVRAPGYLVDKLLKRPRKERPWWPVNCIDYVARYLKPHHKVLEFGAGSSTFWLASRSAFVISIEDDYSWFNSVKSKCSLSKRDNIDIRFGENASYFNPPNVALDEIDLFIVDGNYRWLCLEYIIPKVKVGALIYLDNSDSDKDYRFYQDGQRKRLAQDLILKYSSCENFSSFELHGMIDGEFFGGSGLFLRRDF